MTIKLSQPLLDAIKTLHREESTYAVKNGGILYGLTENTGAAFAAVKNLAVGTLKTDAEIQGALKAIRDERKDDERLRTLYTAHKAEFDQLIPEPRALPRRRTVAFFEV